MSADVVCISKITEKSSFLCKSSLAKTISRVQVRTWKNGNGKGLKGELRIEAKPKLSTQIYRYLDWKLVFKDKVVNRYRK